MRYILEILEERYLKQSEAISYKSVWDFVTADKR